MNRIQHRTAVLLMSIPILVISIFAQDNNFEITPPPHGMPISKMQNPGMPPLGQSVAPPVLLNPSELQALLDQIGVEKGTSGKILAISRNFLRSLDERMIKIQREELNIREELLKDKPDLQAIQADINKKTKIFSEIEFAQIKRDLEIKALLSDQEYEQWKFAILKRMHMLMPPRGHEKMKGDKPKDYPKD